MAKVTFTISMSDYLYTKLNKIAETSGQDLSSILSKAMGLYDICNTAYSEGKSVSILDKDGKIINTFINI